VIPRGAPCTLKATLRHLDAGLDILDLVEDDFRFRRAQRARHLSPKETALFADRFVGSGAIRQPLRSGYAHRLQRVGSKPTTGQLRFSRSTRPEMLGSVLEDIEPLQANRRPLAEFDEAPNQRRIARTRPTRTTTQTALALAHRARAR
jgi:hypothetical protein